MKLSAKIISVITAVMAVGFLAYLKKRGDKHYIISQVLNNMNGYDY